MIHTKRNIKVLLPVLALIAFIAFFPMKYRTGYTCFADRMVSERKPVQMHHPSAGAMRQRYLFPFGLIWWTSVGVLIIVLTRYSQKH